DPPCDLRGARDSKRPHDGGDPLGRDERPRVRSRAEARPFRASRARAAEARRAGPPPSSRSLAHRARGGVPRGARARLARQELPHLRRARRDPRHEPRPLGARRRSVRALREARGRRSVARLLSRLRAREGGNGAHAREELPPRRGAPLGLPHARGGEPPREDAAGRRRERARGRRGGAVTPTIRAERVIDPPAPFAALEKAADLPFVLLLESAARDDPDHSRYSWLAAAPREVLIARGFHVERWERVAAQALGPGAYRVAERLEGPPLRILGERLASRARPSI